MRRKGKKMKKTKAGPKKKYQRKPENRMKRIRLQEPVEQYENEKGEYTRRVVADLVMRHHDVPRGVVKSNFERDRGPEHFLGHVWLTAPEGAYVFVENELGSRILQVRADGHLDEVPVEDQPILWKRLELVSGSSGLEVLLQRVESLQERQIRLFRRTFPELPGDLRYIKRVGSVKDLPEERDDEERIVRRFARDGWDLALVEESRRRGPSNVFGIACRT
jgi:hypothetical protein